MLKPFVNKTDDRFVETDNHFVETGYLPVTGLRDVTCYVAVSP